MLLAGHHIDTLLFGAVAARSARLPHALADSDVARLARLFVTLLATRTTVARAEAHALFLTIEGLLRALDFLLQRIANAALGTFDALAAAFNLARRTCPPGLHAHGIFDESLAALLAWLESLFAHKLLLLPAAEGAVGLHSTLASTHFFALCAL